LLANPPLLERIAEDPILRDIKLIAEAWDAAGVYQVGRFPGQRWSEWNGRYRDDVRRFWRGDAGMIGLLASRLCGSADLYRQSGKEPLNSINYLSCHDGFTLNDLVSYAHKHNQANGEDNRDGMDENYSANYGVEGPTDDPAIESLRKRQIKNLLATLMLSRGVPMLLGGDEFRRSQGGNNNAYCQDNETSWYDWSLLEREQEIHRFTQDMIRLRKRYPLLAEESFYTEADITWFDLDGAAPEWSSAARTLGCHLHPVGHGDQLCLLFNAEAEAVEFALPRGGGDWHMEIDTADMTAKGAAASKRYRMAPHSLAVFSASP
jgi:isoamylase